MRFPKANGEKEALSERLGQGWVLWVSSGFNLQSCSSIWLPEGRGRKRGEKDLLRVRVLLVGLIRNWTKELGSCVYYQVRCWNDGPRGQDKRQLKHWEKMRHGWSQGLYWRPDTAKYQHERATGLRNVLLFSSITHFIIASDQCILFSSFKTTIIFNLLYSPSHFKISLFIFFTVRECFLSHSELICSHEVCLLDLTHFILVTPLCISLHVLFSSAHTYLKETKIFLNPKQYIIPEYGMGRRMSGEERKARPPAFQPKQDHKTHGKYQTTQWVNMVSGHNPGYAGWNGKLPGTSCWAELQSTVPCLFSPSIPS